MGLFKSMRAARQIQKDFESLWYSSNAYRPGDRHDRSGVSPDEVLQRLSDQANRVGMTAGDGGQVATAFIRHIDAHLSYDAALLALLDDHEAGRLETVDAVPLRRLASAEALVEVCEATAIMARPEAFSESSSRSQKEGTDAVPRGSFTGAAAQHVNEQIVADLHAEFTHLMAEPAPLLAEMKRMSQILVELHDLGHRVNGTEVNAVLARAGVEQSQFGGPRSQEDYDEWQREQVARRDAG